MSDPTIETPPAADAAAADAEAAKDAAGEAASKAGDAVGNAAKATKDAAGDAARATKEAAGDAANIAKDAAGDAANKGRDAAKEAADAADEEAAKLADQLGIDWDKAKERIHAGLVDLKNVVFFPLVTGVMTGIGFIAGKRAAERYFYESGVKTYPVTTGLTY